MAALAACGPSSTPAPTGSPTTPQIVTVTGSEKDCTPSEYTVTAGSIDFQVNSVGKESFAFKVYAPQDGAFTKQLGAIPRLRPGQSKQLVVDLGIGAFEISCSTEDSDSRQRITAT